MKPARSAKRPTQSATTPPKKTTKTPDRLRRAAGGWSRDGAWTKDRNKAAPPARRAADGSPKDSGLTKGRKNPATPAAGEKKSATTGAKPPSRRAKAVIQDKPVSRKRAAAKGRSTSGRRRTMTTGTGTEKDAEEKKEVLMARMRKGDTLEEASKKAGITVAQAQQWSRDGGWSRG